jgi:hypothetical protein
MLKGGHCASAAACRLFEVTHAWSRVGQQDGRTLSGSSMKKTEETSETALLRRTCSPGRIVAAVVCTALQDSGV